MDPQKQLAQQLAELESLAAPLNQGEWRLGSAGTETHEEAVGWFRDVISQSDEPDLCIVFMGSPNDIENDRRIVAVTGNGPTSRAHRMYLHAVQPANILALIEQVRQLMSKD